MRIMCSAHSSTTETPFHPSSPRLIKSSSVRFVDPSSHANERFNLQLVSFSIQDKSPSHFFFFSLLLKGRKKKCPHILTPSSLLEERSPPLFSLCRRSQVEALFSLQGGNVLIPAEIRRWCCGHGEDCF